MTEEIEDDISLFLQLSIHILITTDDKGLEEELTVLVKLVHSEVIGTAEFHRIVPTEELLEVEVGLVLTLALYQILQDSTPIGAVVKASRAILSLYIVRISLRIPLRRGFSERNLMIFFSMTVTAALLIP